MTSRRAPSTAAAPTATFCGFTPTGQGDQTVTRTVDVSLAALVEFMSVSTNLPRWYDGWDAVDLPRGTERLQAGTRFRLTRRVGERTETAHCEIQHRPDPRTIAWIELTDHAPPVGVTFRLTPTGPSSTELRYTREFLA
jgi:hypothetical protein